MGKNLKGKESGPPKTVTSYRTIPLTNRAYQILKECYEERNSRKESETLSQILEYIDRRTGEKDYMIMRDLVFVNFVCTHYGILMQPEPLKVGCRLRYCRNYSVTKASKLLWIDMSTSPMIP